MTTKVFISYLALTIMLVACMKNDETFGSKDIAKIALPKETLEMMKGDTVNLDVIFNSRQTRDIYKEFIWRIEDPAVAKLESSSGSSVSVVAMAKGTTMVVVESSDKKLSASRQINIIGSTELLQPLYIDFGVSIFGKPFNTVANPKNNKLVNLLDSKDNLTGIDLEITNDFEGENTLGVSNNQLGLPSSATGDAFWGSNANPDAEVRISHLNRNKYYDFSFYGSRREVGDNRETAYTVKGRYAAETIYQNASNNVSVISTIKKVRPNSDGEVVISIKAGPNNTNDLKYFYLSAMMIEPSSN